MRGAVRLLGHARGRLVELARREAVEGRAGQALAVDVVAADVGAAVPRPLGLVEAYDAAHVRAHGRDRVQESAAIAVDGQPFAADTHDATLIALDVARRGDIGGLEASADQARRDVLVVADE